MTSQQPKRHVYGSSILVMSGASQFMPRLSSFLSLFFFCFFLWIRSVYSDNCDNCEKFSSSVRLCEALSNSVHLYPALSKPSPPSPPRVPTFPTSSTGKWRITIVGHQLTDLLLEFDPLDHHSSSEEVLWF
ncbi:hypothetical protein F5879DRAFT_19834 [Lentinula edodes]|nr:hypothetical protein F5879DRAFT_19834 [Lentinula edodes]